MSKDIRSYFFNATKKATFAEPKKRKAITISSDEEEDGKTSNDTNKKLKNSHEGSRSSSRKDDSKDDKKPILKNINENKRKLVDVNDIFGSQPVKRVEKPKSVALPKSKQELDSMFDDDFDISDILEVSIDSKTPVKEAPKIDKCDTVDTGKTEKSEVSSGKKPNKSIKHYDATTDEERHEKKRMCAMLYQSFKNRGGPPNPGSKEVPEGKRNCFAGLTFVMTGVQECFDRDELTEIIKKYGGKVTTSLSKKTSYLITGEDAGLSKTAKADELGTRILTEDEFLNLILKKSNIPVAVNNDKINNKSKQNTITTKVEKNIKLENGKSPKKEKIIKSEITKSPKKEQHIKLENIKSPKKEKNIKSKTVNLSEEKNKSIKSPKKEQHIKLENIKSPKKEKNIKSETENLAKEKNKSKSPEKAKYKKEESSTSGALKVNGHKTQCNGEVKSIKSDQNKDLEVERTTTEHQLNISSTENKAWVEKYKPTTTKEIIGQQGAASNCVKLSNWLKKWYINHNGKTKLSKPNPWAKNDDGAYFRAALLSGPPGVGKTTTANLVCKELGFDVVEFNASDTRSKRLLKEEVSELLSNKTLFGYFHEGSKTVTKKHVLIMDEVDGMAGNEDRGGMQELISLIKEASVPVICMCNDRNHQKMKSLVNYCYDLRFSRPRLEQIKGAMFSICFKEGIKLSASVLEEVITATNNDIRQTLNYMTLLSANKLIPVASNQLTNEKHAEVTAKKDMKLGPWEVVRKVFSAEEHKNMTFTDKSDLFFNDYSLGPLFVQQNYLSVSPKVPKVDVPTQVALAADSLSRGDLVESRIRSKMAWSMLPVQAMYSSVLPGEYMKGHFTGQINFPAWLGKFSKSNKRSRLAQEIHDHTRIRTSGSRLSVRLDYAPFLIQKIIRPLVDKGLEGVAESLETIKEYHLLREDIDSLIELTAWPGKKNPFDAVESKVKAALTRAYNKEVNPYSYSVTNAIKKKKSDKMDMDDINNYGDDENDVQASLSDEEGDDDNVNDDVLIKAKKSKAETSKASTSKAKASGSGRGKSKSK